MKEAKMYLKVILAFFIYALSMLFSKYASMQEDMLIFCILYGISLVFMGIYAICWQMILKHVSLSKVYPFKSLTILFSMLFGYILFKESITINMFIGMALIIIGVYLIGSEQDE